LHKTIIDFKHHY